MRFFIDSEFIECGAEQPIFLMSLAVVSDTGEEFYAERLDIPFHRASAFVRTNVLPNLRGCEAVMPDDSLRRALLAFLDRCRDEHPIQFWGYYADYDWVALCQFFGTMDQIPEGWPYYCRDLKQVIDAHPIASVDLPAASETHNALDDARWIREAAHIIERTYVELR